MFKFTSCFCNSFSIAAINYINKSIGIVEVVPPKRAEFFLATYIPDCEYYILILDLFNIKTCMWKKQRERKLKRIREKAALVKSRP
jgi:hypothetical protein